MKPMEPMTPMAPMAPAEPWWPRDLGEPAASGGQDGMRYAYFPASRRLAVERDGTVALYDSGTHRIGGVAQDGRGEPVFRGEGGEVALKDLRKLD